MATMKMGIMVMVMVMVMMMMGCDESITPSFFVMGVSAEKSEKSEKSYAALFVFGDSLVDVGNNNYIATAARSDMKPFGIDFPAGPTGRFSNGKVVVDYIAERFGLPFAVPYLDPTTRGATILKGVSYASAAAGIIRSTGYNFIGRVDLDTQIAWFENNVQELTQMLGAERTADFLSKSLFAVIIGSNDYVNNYLLGNSATGRNYTIPDYQDLLVDTFISQLNRMYELGARSVSVASIGPIGCIPSQLVKANSNGECVEFVNKLAQDFNAVIEARLPSFNAKLPGAKFLYGDVFNPIFDYRQYPEKFGFKYGDTACCGAGKFKGQLLCLPFVTPCEDRGDYVFWDAFHPTEKANGLVAESLYKRFVN